MVQSSGYLVSGLKERPGMNDGPDDVYAPAGAGVDSLLVPFPFAALELVEGAAVVVGEVACPGDELDEFRGEYVNGRAA